MKKVLFCAGLLGLMASCADQDLDGVAGNSGKVEGITFEMAEADTRIQYDKDGSTWNPFWYAEQDRVSIWANGVNKGFPTVSSTAAYGRWTALSATATYKATKSEAKAAFTSVDDVNMLTFIDGTKDAKFFAVYPATTESMTTQTGRGTTPDTLQISNLFNGLESQNIESAKGANPAMVMIAHTTAKRANVYDAVGEKVALSFNYVTPILKFGTSGLDATYQNAFGKLREIQVQNTGYQDPSGDATKDIAAPALVYGNGATLQVDTLNWTSAIKPATTSSSSPNNITVTLNNGAGLAWSDEALAPVVVAITDHSAFSATKPDTLKSMLVFENIDLADKGANGDQDGRYLSSSLTPSSNFKAITFNLSKYPWLVTKNTTANTRTLFVNSGNLADIFTVDATGNVKWTDTQATSGLVAPTEIETVVIKSGVVIANADFTKLNKMINIKHLTIEDLPTVPANAFKSLANLKTLRLLNTTTIANANAIASTAALDSIVMPEYKFEDEAINAAFLKKTSLRYLDMGAEVMNAGFPARGLSLEGFALLYEVKVKDGIKVGANAFKDCALLEKVNGRVDIVGSYAFANCAKLTAINISSQDVLSGSFSGCTLLKTIKVNGGNFVPTSVGSEAFKNATKINVDLASATTIGASAFEGATALTGIKHTGETVNVLRVAAATISENAFKNCTAIDYIYFVNATSVKNGILSGVTVKEIKFGEKFSVATALAAGTFGTITDTKLFVAPGQEGVSGNILTTGTGSGARTFQFGQIIEEPKY